MRKEEPHHHHYHARLGMICEEYTPLPPPPKYSRTELSVMQRSLRHTGEAEPPPTIVFRGHCSWSAVWKADRCQVAFGGSQIAGHR